MKENIKSTYTEEQIRQAGIDGEINHIDVEHLITILSGAKKEDIPSKESQKQSLIELNAGTAEVTATPKPINNKN